MKKWFTRLGLALALFAGTTTAMAQQTLVVDGTKSYLWELTKGTDYTLPGTDGTWYCQPGFFTHKDGEVWTFQGYDMANYAYAINLDAEMKYIQVELLNATEGEGVEAAPTATYDVNGAIYINGNENIGFPSFAANKINWGKGKDVPVPQVDMGVYQLVMVGGQQISSSSINFKFFKGKKWGGDMGTSVLWLEDNDYIYMGQQVDAEGNAASGDNGNLYGKNGNIGDLDTLIVTVDFNKVHDGLGTITVEKKAYTPAAYPQINGTNLDKFGNAYYANLSLTKGQELSLTNLDAIDVVWDDLYVNEYFAKKGADGKLTFNAVDGEYCIAVLPNINLIRIYPGTYDAPATYENAKALWIIGNDQIGLPSYSTMPSGWGEANSWNPTLDHSIAVAQVEPNIYKIGFTIGKELGSEVNFKFYGAGTGWGTEFRGEDLEMVANDYLMLKQPESTIGYDTNGNEVLNYGDEDGNIRNGSANLGKGDQITLTIDLNDFAFHKLDPETLEVACQRGKVTVEYIPYGGLKPEFGGVQMISSGDWYYADVELEQGKSYELKNLTETTADALYTDVCFATYEGDNMFTAKAVSGDYCVMVNPVTNYLKIFPGSHDVPATINEGGLWIIGEGFGRPSVKTNAVGWNTGIEKDCAVAQTSKDIYQMDLMCDTEMWDNWCNWKFFGQPGWGIEFVPGTDYSITSANDWLNVGESDGNIGFKEGASFVKGEPIYIVVDFTGGLNAGIMQVSTEPIIEGIKSIMTVGNATENAIYNLNGMRVSNASQHGVYIMNGKKVIK